MFTVTDARLYHPNYELGCILLPLIFLVVLCYIFASMLVTDFRIKSNASLLRGTEIVLSDDNVFRSFPDELVINQHRETSSTKSWRSNNMAVGRK